MIEFWWRGGWHYGEPVAEGVRVLGNCYGNCMHIGTVIPEAAADDTRLTYDDPNVDRLPLVRITVTGQ